VAIGAGDDGVGLGERAPLLERHVAIEASVLVERHGAIIAPARSTTA
jgi:hypothetical protein